MGEGTRTDLALTLANTELFSEQGGDRVDKSNVLVVITDGKTNPQLSQPYSEVLQPLKASIVIKLFLPIHIYLVTFSASFFPLN